MKLILLESYEADLSNSGYNIQFGEELTEIQTNLYSVCKHSDTFLAHCILWNGLVSMTNLCQLLQMIIKDLAMLVYDSKLEEVHMRGIIFITDVHNAYRGLILCPSGIW